MIYKPSTSSLEAFEIFLNRFILEGKNAFFQDETIILTDDNLSACFGAYVEKFMPGKQVFGNKIRIQFAEESLETRLVFAHAEWLWAFASTTITIEKKIFFVKRAFEGTSNQLPILDKDMFPDGIGAGGNWHNRDKYNAIRFNLELIRFLFQKRKEGRITELETAKWYVKNVCLWTKYHTVDTDFPLITGSFSDSISMRNILLYCSSPMHFERIVSDSDKNAIIETFKNEILTKNFSSENMDEKIEAIRSALSQKYNKAGFDFYDDSEISSQWRKRVENTEDGGDIVEDGDGLDYKTNSKAALNTILFGPPGTGKTYNSIAEAVKIIRPGFGVDQDRNEIKKEFDRLSEAGRIEFVTFHQSMSYEDFVEGIKPLPPTENGDEQLKYDIKKGVFRKICDNSKPVGHPMKSVDWDQKTYYKMSLGGKDRPDIHNWCISNNVIALGWGGDQDLSNLLEIKSLQEFKETFKELYPDLVAESSFHIDAVFRFQKMKENDVVVVSKGNRIVDAIGIVKGPYFWDDKNDFGYYHFRKVEWIATNLDASPERFFKSQISQMSIYRFSEVDINREAFKHLTQPISDTDDSGAYVLIIDEINRGNISQIFGELITLIEEDKRSGKSEALEISLTYSREKFSIPSNLYIIGTMNTADRSVEALDTALRRRFSFIETPPQPSIIAKEGELKNENGILQVGDLQINLVALMEKINRRIEKLLDKDHLIGHSYFMKVKDLDTLQDAFYRNIIPLLQEYFYGDFGKIGLVLGAGFVQKNPNIPNEKPEKLFAEFETNYSDDLNERPVYRITDYRLQSTMEIEFQRKKYSCNFTKAISLLIHNSIE